MEPADLLCSRNARPQKGGRGAARPSFLLAEAARSECAPSMREQFGCSLRKNLEYGPEGALAERAQ